MDDKSIIDLYFKRSELAIKYTDEKYRSYLYKISFNLLGNLEDAEECINDTYLSCWENIPPQIPRYFPAWIGRIIRNKSYNLWNKNHRDKRNQEITIALEELENTISSNKPIDKNLEEKEISKLLNKWLSNLDKEDRIIFVKRYWFCEKLKDIALEYDINPNNLSQRMYRLRNSLKDYLIKEGIIYEKEKSI